MKNIILFVILNFLVSCGKKEKSVEKNISEEKKIVKDTISVINVPTKEIPSGNIKNIYLGCGYNYKLSKAELNLSMPNQREIDQIQKILSFSGIPLNFEIYSANIENAVATIINNKRYIIYDPKLLEFTDNSTNSYWSSMSILAHEIGHHLSGHTLSNNLNSLKIELEADKFSGFVLYKMGANIEQSTRTISIMGSENDSKTHPSKYKRIEAIKNGWEEASKQRYQGALAPPPRDNASDFYEFTSDMIIENELIQKSKEMNLNYYDKYYYLFGIISEVNNDLSSFKIRIIKSSKEFNSEFRKIENEDWEVNINSIAFGADNNMCRACETNFRNLIVPGRRLKFSMVEGCPDCGSSMNGIWTLTYAKAIESNSF